MRKTFFILPVAVLCSISLLLVTGCAKKAVVKEEATVKEGKAAKETKPQPTAAKDDKAAKTKKTAKEDAGSASAKNLYEMSDIRFDFDAYSLKDESRETLKKHAEWLNKNQKVAITIEGNCDERGTAEYNLALGERRAAEAKKYIVKLGVGEKRVNTISYGKERPLDQGHDEAAWAKNRRDHFVSQQ